MTMTNQIPVESKPQTPRFLWVEYIKAFALLWIFLNHVTERILGAPYIANPWASWPPLAERIAQLQPLHGSGILDIPLNLVRYVGWAGDQGVQLFLIISGFGLTWGLLTKQGHAPLGLLSFYKRRLARIYPLWWIAHLFFLLATIVFVRFGSMSLRDSAFYFSILGIRVLPSQIYYFSPAWWYISLLIQLYLVYPLLWKILRSRGPVWLMVVIGGGAILLRGVGLLAIDHYFPDYLDAWSRGAIFITRLPEFVFGMSLAVWMQDRPEQINRILRRPSTLLLAIIIYIGGTILSLYLVGMAAAPFLLGLGVFVLLYALFSRNHHDGPVVWIGRHSYALYLAHNSMIIGLIPVGLGYSLTRIGAGVIGAIAATLVTALFFEQIERRITGWHSRFGMRGLLLRLGTVAVVIGGGATRDGMAQPAGCSPGNLRLGRTRFPRT